MGRNSSHAVMTTTSDVSVTAEKLEQAEEAMQNEEETRQPEPKPPKQITPKSGLININTATQEELETLPGIGEELAGRIIEHRKLIGGFREKSDICNVMGIGEKKYEAIKTLITVG